MIVFVVYLPSLVIFTDKEWLPVSIIRLSQNPIVEKERLVVDQERAKRRRSRRDREREEREDKEWSGQRRGQEATRFGQ